MPAVTCSVLRAVILLFLNLQPCDSGPGTPRGRSLGSCERRPSGNPLPWHPTSPSFGPRWKQDTSFKSPASHLSASAPSAQWTRTFTAISSSAVLFGHAAASSSPGGVTCPNPLEISQRSSRTTHPLRKRKRRPTRLSTLGKTGLRLERRGHRMISRSSAGRGAQQRLPQIIEVFIAGPMDRSGRVKGASTRTEDKPADGNTVPRGEKGAPTEKGPSG